ncbi:hypothetical protein UCRPC4_g05679 [Phaeomoniella chlamydospora]|uniref:Uncharacterized protein n=1 Tax=Phaeomoniella chlamydospora TaxID=158046 RepID=A0A0G2E4B3_PHACM|nr:hypothetical protein UCRPC4_g05679 [Phaeomoniella chlamydospora]
MALKIDTDVIPKSIQPPSHPVHMQVTVAAAEGANANVNVSVEATPDQPNIHVTISAGNEANEAEDNTLIEPAEDAQVVRNYAVGPGNTTTDEFDIVPERKGTEDAPPGFKLRRTKTLTIPETDPKHEYEYYQVRKGHPKERDPLWFPVVTEYPAKNSYANLWVKMDTGADVNLIAMGTVVDLGVVDQIRPWSPVDGKNIEEIGGNKFSICGCITLSFYAGHARRPFKAEFLIPTDKEGIDNKTDGLPDVLVGWDFLINNHLLMVDVDYHNDVDDEYETLAVHTCEEREIGVLKACPLLRPNAVGGGGGGGRGAVRVRPGASGVRR